MKHDIVGDYVSIFDEYDAYIHHIDTYKAEYLINLGAQAKRDNQYIKEDLNGDWHILTDHFDPLQVLKDTAS